jgi:hypothetical protein
MAESDKSIKPSAFNDILKWGISTLVYSGFVFILSIIAFLPIFILFNVLDLPKLLFWFGVIGFVAVGIKNYHTIKPEETKRAIELIGYNLLVFGSTIANYVSFSISVIISLYVITLSNLGFLIPLFWFIGEREVIKRAWFLSPSIIVFTMIVWAVKRLQVHDITPDISRATQYKIHPNP